jgi:polyphenol oxidase
MLPQPDDGFAWVQVAGGDALVCRALERFALHLFTTHAWRIGSAPANRRDDGWSEAAAAVGVDAGHLVRVTQVHGSAIFAARGDAALATRADPPAADIVVTDDRRIAIAIQTADCVPLLIADRRSGAVAAAHAGWRGMAARVPQKAVAALQGEFGSDPADLIAAIGPSIGACCYEVGADVRDAFAAAGFEGDHMRPWFTDAPRPTARNPSMPGIPRSLPRPDRWYFDGWSAVRHQLEKAGVRPDHVHAANLCTGSHLELCSYRRDGSAAGRMAAVIRSCGAGG